MKNLFGLVASGKKNVSTIAKSILASSLLLEDLNELMEQNKLKRIGVWHYYKLKRNFRILNEGNDIQTNEYSSRIPILQIKTALEFISTTLPSIPGLLKSRIMFGHYFKNFPVFQLILPRKGRS